MIDYLANQQSQQRGHYTPDFDEYKQSGPNTLKDTDLRYFDAQRGIDDF